MGLELEDVKNRLQKGLYVSPAENVAFIKSNPYALAAFMIENNPGNVNNSLRKLGYTHLGFAPNKVALARQMEILIDRNETAEIKEILSKFNVNRKALTPEFLKEFDKAFLTT